MMINPHYQPRKPHHTQTGFRNNYIKEIVQGSLWQWQKERIAKRIRKMFATPVQLPVTTPDIAWLASNRTERSLTWIGHSTAVIQVAGLNIVTDPVFAERASPLTWAGPKRLVRPAMLVSELPRIDIVLISHNHYDHLDRASVLELNAQAGGPPVFFVPLGVKAWMVQNGITNVIELDWWDKYIALGVEMTFLPAQHWSSRGLHDKCATLWGGWAVATKEDPSPFSVYFAGDTGYSKDFEDIGAAFGGFDVALLPIGAYDPRWFMRDQHVDPGESVQIHKDIKATKSIAIHWGTFALTDEPVDEPPVLLKKAMLEHGLDPETFLVLQHGQTIAL
jgi:N-acyl-phosphatidylethanolamine-hydrolysing phospholipase D